MIKLAKENGFELFHIPASVGGRFSELCPVGLLPAAVCGIDIREMLAGAAAMDERCSTDDVWKNPALLEAVLQYICMEDMGINVQVCGQPQVHGGLVLSAVGREPGQECNP